jgi:Tol biopolymer transport system component
VAFTSAASNLVDGDTNGTYDIFVHDRQMGQTSRVSVSSAGQEGNSRSFDPGISADGRYVAFRSNADNLVEGDTNGGIFVHDRQTGQTGWLSHGGYPSISADGRYVAFHSYASNLVEDDTNEHNDIFVHDCFGY